MYSHPYTYEECKIMDIEYSTPVSSPLHRSNRFPSQWIAEGRKEWSAYTVVSTPMTPAS